jgi:hypothetical protein
MIPSYLLEVTDRIVRRQKLKNVYYTRVSSRKSFLSFVPLLLRHFIHCAYEIANVFGDSKAAFIFFIIFFVLPLDFGEANLKIEQVAPLLPRLATLDMNLDAALVGRRWQRALWPFVAVCVILMVARKNEIILARRKRQVGQVKAAIVNKRVEVTIRTENKLIIKQIHE